MESVPVSFKPNTAQKTAIYNPPGPLMILAGAGTGKTTTLLHRVNHLIQSKQVLPEHMLLLTFTEKATSEIRKKIRDLIGQSADDITISTFHGFCNALVREHAIDDNAEKLLWQEEDITYFFINHFDQLTFIKSRIFRANPYGAITDSFIPFINRTRDELLAPTDINKLYDPTVLSSVKIEDIFPNLHIDADQEDILLQLADLIQLFDFFQDKKNELGVADYGDMILDCWTMLNMHPYILNIVRDKYQHIFIDEYQDNNYALNKIINLIAGNEPSITVVGDEDQCIYSFRGANYYNIKDFKDRYQSLSNYSAVKLVENYRSSSEILNLANASIICNSNRQEKTLYRPQELPKNGPKPVWFTAESKETIIGVPLLVRDLVENQNHLFGDVAVICRTWGHVKSMADALQQAAIPVDTHVEKFFNVPIVKDVLAWGHLIAEDEQAEAGLFRILKTLLGHDWASNFYNDCKQATFTERLAAMTKESNNNTTVSWALSVRESLLDTLKQKPGPDEMVWAILSILKQTPRLEQLRTNYRYQDRLNLVNMARIMSLAERFTTIETTPSLGSWLHHMNIMQMNFALDAAQPLEYDKHAAVQVLTVHQAKGLEFPIVIVPFLRAGSFPMRLKRPKVLDSIPETWKKWSAVNKATTNEVHLQEERRVFHVACTRARDKLYLYGPTKSQSIFTKELVIDNQETMEIRAMSINEKTLQHPKLTEQKQRLLVDLSREIAARQYDNASQILVEMQNLEEENFSETGSNQLGSENLLRLSASSIGDYETCPYKYRLKHIDKVPERKTRVTMEFGIIIHNVLDELHGSEDQSLDNILQLLEKHWRTEAFEYLLREEEFKIQARELLTAYHKYIQNYPPQVVARERKFSFIIDELQVMISGKIDRIDQEGNRLAVVDYKTSKNKEKAKGSLQLALYTEALNRDAVESVSGKPGSTVLHFLRHPDDPLESHVFNTEDLDKQMEKVAAVCAGIRRYEFPTKPGDFICRNCDYREFLCPAWEDN